MLIATSPLSDAGTWLRTSGLQVLLVLTGAVLLSRGISWAGNRVTERIDARAGSGDPLVRSEASKHRHALAQVATWVVLVALWCVAAVLVLSRLGVPVAGLVAPATVAGVALGFGAQRIVQDLLAGFFLVAERQYGYGDLVRISVGGGLTPLTGTVEDVSLRITQIRTVNGEVVITPNGQIMQVTNLSRDWARAVVDVPVPAGADVNEVSATLAQVGEDAYADKALGSLLLDPPAVMGVESLEVDQLNIRLVARTLPGKQFDVGRQLRARAATALRRQGLRVSPGSGGAEPTSAT